MAADVAKLTGALDKVFKTFSSQEVQLNPKEMKGLGERGTAQYIEQKFQAQLQRARAAFLQEFRNHAVVVENEVRKIRDELTSRMEERYGEKIAALREQLTQSEGLVQSHRLEIAQLKSLTAAQETYLTAARHRWGLEHKVDLKSQVQTLAEEKNKATKETEDLKHQLMCRDELVSQLGGELSALETELKRQANSHTEETRDAEERVQGLLTEMQLQQKAFIGHLSSYEEQFAVYKAKTERELALRDILNTRLSEALQLMDEERKRHIKANTKPTARIGEDGESEDDEARYQPYQLEKNAKYRIDDMGMDTSWRDYKISDMQLAVPGGRKAKPLNYKVERVRKVVPGPGTSGTDTPRSTRQMQQLPPTPTDTASP
eukprot:TRINITY_DN64317_c0_g1_i1.p1 TRINITY_DN64317_c0_g1~~TRINITY_DN64317_c0_g1_i1.p1  ORF type:complete len:375 (-),score=88.42 TRINITY_DN64317_c0_g1_i1:152-1276(-)